jgi:hypothetical protein
MFIGMSGLVDVGEKDLPEGGRRSPIWLRAACPCRQRRIELPPRKKSRLRNDQAMLRNNQAMMSGVI